MSSVDTVLLFPGRNRLSEAALDVVRDVGAFSEYYDIVCQSLGADLDAALLKTSGRDQHVCQSLATILVNALSWQRLRERANFSPRGTSGYSVGQWSAIHAAGVVDFAQVVKLTHLRAQLLKQCAQRTPGGMVAVLGVDLESLERLCQSLRRAGRPAYVANLNAPAHFTLAYAEAARESLFQELAALSPLRVVELALDGPWHCGLMVDARDKFLQALRAVRFHEPHLPIVENVDARPLPSALEDWPPLLADHLCSPVQWQGVISTWVSLGCQRFVEVGHGEQLSRFGFFIDRTVEHTTANKLIG